MMLEFTHVLLGLLPVGLIVLSLFGEGVFKREKTLSLLVKVILSATLFTGLYLYTKLYVNDEVYQIYFGELDYGLSLRFDTLSVLMLLMISVIGFVVVRFSETYLQGDTNHLGFMRKLTITIGMVQLLVLSGGLTVLWLFWVGKSLSLHYLIGFFKERPQALKAARKKFFVARLSDLSLLISIGLIYLSFGTLDIASLVEQIRLLGSEGVSIQVELAAVFLALSAVFKSVQVPFHGWVLDVMEAPTPVSGLLHAGLLNAGPFLVIRFAFLFEETSIGSIMILIIGALSAWYGTIVFPSQSSIKTSLAYSSVAHMGFSLMVCGMGLYSAALLHLVAHSFYKAHSFLSSGGMIDKYRLKQFVLESKTQAKASHLIISLLITGSAFVLMSENVGGFNQLEIQLKILGGIIVCGVSSYMTRLLVNGSSFKIIGSSVILSIGVLMSFFLFENLISELIVSQVPEIQVPSSSVLYVSLFILTVYALTAFIQLLTNKTSELYRKWEVHKRNGFYLHLYFDRM